MVTSAAISIVYMVIFIAAAGFCLAVLNKLPKDISAIVNAIRERDKRELPAAIGVALFFWTITAILAWKIVIPGAITIVYGWGKLIELFQGF